MKPGKPTSALTCDKKTIIKLTRTIWYKYIYIYIYIPNYAYFFFKKNCLISNGYISVLNGKMNHGNSPKVPFDHNPLSINSDFIFIF